MISAEGEILDVNKAAIDILGYNKNELINKVIAIAEQLAERPPIALRSKRRSRE
jgi:PAS domain S-box-containing protein